MGEAAAYAKMGGGDGSGGALDSFALLSSADWKNEMLSMEAEKDDMLGLDVRVSSF